MSVIASLYIQVMVTCPHCEEFFDLIADTDLNAEGNIIRQAISDEAFSRPESERLNTECTCQKCKNGFTINGLVW